MVELACEGLSLIERTRKFTGTIQYLLYKSYRLATLSVE